MWLRRGVMDYKLVLVYPLRQGSDFHFHCVLYIFVGEVRLRFIFTFWHCSLYLVPSCDFFLKQWMQIFYRAREVLKNEKKELSRKIPRSQEKFPPKFICRCKNINENYQLRKTISWQTFLPISSYMNKINKAIYMKLLGESDNYI